MSFSHVSSEVFLPVPITTQAHEYAQEFAKHQPTQQKQTQVYYNTLAVCVVRDYLECMGIPTQLEASDSWNPVTQLCGDVADLEVVGVGRLECRPIQTEQSTCFLPAETWCDRQGYVVVQIDRSFREAFIVGFSPTANNGVLKLNQLRAIADLPEYLHERSTATNGHVPLNHWLAGIVAQGWQNLDALLEGLTLQPSYALRSQGGLLANDESTWGKLINLGLQMGDRALVLLIALKPENNSMLTIQVRLQASDSSDRLPSGVSLSLISDSGETLQTRTAREQDIWIQLSPFEGEIQETFRVKVIKDDLVFQEDFTI